MNLASVTTTTLRWVGDWPWFVGLGAAAILAIIAWLLYRRDTGAMRPIFRLLLPLLRALTVFLIVLLISGPVLHHRTVVGGLAKLVVLLDGSESMQLADPGMDAGRKIQILERLKMLNSGSVNLDLPQASAALAEAKNLADGLASIGSPTPESCKKITGEFATLTARADGLFAKSAQAAEQLDRFRNEVAKPAAELGARDINSVDDLNRATQDLAKLSAAADRWSAEIGAVFEKALGTQNPAVKDAFAKFDALPRHERVQALLLGGKKEDQLLGKLASQFDIQIATMVNSEVKRTWQSTNGDAPVPLTLPKPTGLVTNLQTGLDYSLNSGATPGKGAVILITDGQQNSGESAVETAKILKGKDMKVYALGTGSHIAPTDVAIIRTTIPEGVYHEDVARGEILIRQQARPNLPLTVTINDGDKVVWEKKITTESNPDIKLPFEFPVKELAAARTKALPEGVKALGVAIELKVKVTAVEDEKELSNNESMIRFRAVTQKRKILIVDGRSRWETRYLKNLYQRDEKWDVNTVMGSLRTDQGFLRGDKEGNFPAEKAGLDAYDLIIFGEVPKGMLKPEEIRWIAEFVNKRGGAIIFIDGARGHLKEYGDTPLGPLLPVEYDTNKPAESIKSLGLTGRASDLAPFSMSEEIAQNAETWSKLPVPKSVASVKALPGAEVLMDGETTSARVPLGILRPYGAGKVYYHAFDDSWRWRYEVADKYHVKFWNQIATFVSEEPFAASDKNVSLDAGKLTYAPGDQANIRVRLRNGEGKPVTDAAVSAILKKDDVQVAVINLTPDEGGLFRGKTAPLEPGNYQVEVDSAAIPPGKIKVTTPFTVESLQKIERTVLSVNEDLLRQISLTSGGQYFREEQIDQIIKLLEPMTAGNIEESESRLLESKWWFAALVILLTAEWLIRKRIGML